MSFNEDYPRVIIGKRDLSSFDWRSHMTDEDVEDEDAPASEFIIDMLGFDPDEEEEEDIDYYDDELDADSDNDSEDI